MAEDSETETQLAWHYTTAAGLLSILTTNRLWATSAVFMNDVEEMRTGRTALLSYIDSQRSTLSPWQENQIAQLGLSKSTGPSESFLLSAALDGDLLTLWRNYGGGQVAYSIAIDRTQKLLPVEQVAGYEHPFTSEGYQAQFVADLGDGEFEYLDPDTVFIFGGQWRKVQYIVDPWDSAVKREFDRLKARLVRPDRGENRVPFLNYSFVDSPTNIWKHHGFRDEREDRAAWSVNPSWKFVRFRAQRFGVVPYIEVSQTNGTRQGYVPAGSVMHLPIKSIRIGPTPVADDAETALRVLLDNTGYNDVKILRSVTPFR